ncbi:MAG TPA: efflux RND transporter periplasmic adaptor subunit [Brumimicrobium sp.]|nr:efflux RND transporter periplasmic adaptor subunit [Brumimicrobium sp.]
MFRAITGIIAVGLLSACGGGKQEQGSGKRIGTYKVLELETTNATLIAEYPASLEGIKDIDIRPKIDGYIDEVLVDEGQTVKKGQLLFRISNPQYSQDMKSLQASVAAAESAVDAAELQVTKTRPLSEKGIVSAFELQNAEINLKTKESDLENAKARYLNTVTNVGYTQVKSPVDGVVGTIPYRIGSYVNSATAQPLTRVSDISVIQAYFSIGEKQQLNLMADLEGTTFEEKINHLPEVNLILSNGRKYEELGKIKSFSGLINPKTGAFSVRADFPNASGMLRSGGSAIVQIPQVVENAILIPQKASFELQDKRMVYLLKEGVVTASSISVRSVPGGKFFIVDEGLTKGDKILIEGVGILSEGAEINPEFVKMSDILNEGK